MKLDTGRPAYAGQHRKPWKPPLWARWRTPASLPEDEPGPFLPPEIPEETTSDTA